MEKVDLLINYPAVYELGDSDGNVVFIGSTNDFRKDLVRLIKKRPKGVANFRYDHYGAEWVNIKAMLLCREYFKKYGKPPPLQTKFPHGLRWFISDGELHLY